MNLQRHPLYLSYTKCKLETNEVERRHGGGLRLQCSCWHKLWRRRCQTLPPRCGFFLKNAVQILLKRAEVDVVVSVAVAMSLFRQLSDPV